jgi:hypothetical protein
MLQTVTSVYDLPVEGVRMEDVTLTHIEQCMSRNSWSLAFGHNDDMKAAPSHLIGYATATCLWQLGTPLMMSLLLTISGGSVRHADCKTYPASSTFPFSLIERHGEPFATWRPFASFIYFFATGITVAGIANIFSLMALVTDYMYPNYAVMTLCKEAGWIPVSAESPLFYNGTFINAMSSSATSTSTANSWSGASDYLIERLSWHGSEAGTIDTAQEFYHDAWIWEAYIDALFMRLILIVFLTAAILGYGNFFTTGGNAKGQEGSVSRGYTREQKLEHDFALLVKRSGITEEGLARYTHDLLFLDSILKESGINDIYDRMQIIDKIKTSSSDN